MARLEILGLGKRRSALKSARRAADKRVKARVNLVQQLERRDHPGGMLPVSLISLLGDPVNDSGESGLGHQLHSDRLQGVSGKKAHSQRSAPALGHASHSFGVPFKVPELKNSGRSVHRSNTDQSVRRQVRPDSSALGNSSVYDSVSQQVAGSFLSEGVGTSVANHSESNAEQPLLSVPSSGSGGGGGGGGGKLAPSFAANSGGHSMQSSSSPSSRGGGGGGGGGSPESGESSQTSGGSNATVGQGSSSGPAGAEQSASVDAAKPAAVSISSDNSNVPETSFPQIDISSYQLNDTQVYVTGTVSAPTSKSTEYFISFASGSDGSSLGEVSLGDEFSDAEISVFELSLVLPSDVNTSSLIARLQVGQATNEPSNSFLEFESQIIVGSDADGDGISDEIELLHEAGDANLDGVLDSQQGSVASVPDARSGSWITIVADGHDLTGVRPVSLTEDSIAARRMPFGMIGFDLSGVEPGGIASVDLSFPPGSELNDYYKQTVSGNIERFDFNGQTGAIIDGSTVTMFLQDGGRGDLDGLANGVILDPGAPSGGMLLIGPGYPDPLDGWSVTEFGGQASSEGQVLADSGDLLITEGDSLLVELSQAITIPNNPTVLELKYEGAFDTANSGFINDAFELALLDEDGFSVVPTYVSNRDSFFNLTEEELPALGAGTLHDVITVSPSLSGFAQVDISSLPADATYQLVVRLVNNDGDSGTWFRLKANSLAMSVSPVIGDEGVGTALSATLPGVSSTVGYSAVVDWGDGSPSESATLGLVGDDLVIDATHVYADDRVTDYSVSVTLTHNQTHLLTQSTTASINNQNPVVVAATDQVALLGQSHDFSLGSFTDLGFTSSLAQTSEDFTVSVDWGDGSATEAITPSIANGSVNQATQGTLPLTPHTYATPGTFNATITVIDDDGGSASDSFTVTTSAPSMTIAPVLGDESQIVSLNASVTGVDPNQTYLADIVWGDGTSTSDASTTVINGVVQISADHAYADDQVGDYTVSVTLRQATEVIVVETANAVIANVDPSIDFIQDIAINNELQPAGQERRISFTAPFGDVGLLDTHTYSIDWGDGTTSSGALTTTNGTGTVSGVKDYVANGTYSVAVTVMDDDGGVAERRFRAYIAGDIVTITEDSYVELDLSGLEVAAGYNNELGMFIVEDVDGSIRDSNGSLLQPGDSGYALAAISHSSRRVILHQDFMAQTKDMAGPSRQQHNYRVMVEAGSFVSFYAIQNQTTDWWLANNPSNTIDPNAYKRVAFFTAREANPDDAHPHFRVTTLPDGALRYGHEDLLRGQYNVPGQHSDEDYDDLNFTIRITPITQTQEPKFFVDNDATTDDRIFFYNSQGNAVQSELAPHAANTQSIGLTSNYQGDHLWSIDRNGTVYDYTYTLTPHALASTATWAPKTTAGSSLNQPTDIATDSTDIWVVDKNGSSSRVYYYPGTAATAPSGNVDATASFTLHSQNADPSGLAVNADRIFVTDLADREVYVYERSTGNYQGKWDLDPGNQTPTDITTEPTGPGTFGTNLYVVDKTRGEVFVYPDSVDWINNGNPNADTLLAKNSTWEYLVTDDEPVPQSGTNANWKELSYDDSAWSSGQAPLGYGTSQTTNIGYGGNANDKNNTTYFRREFQVSEEDYTGLTLALRRDDGAVVYINGLEVARHNMNFGDVDYTTRSRGNSNSTSSYSEIKISPSKLVQGTNVIAVEVHKWTTSGSSSNQLIMDAELKTYVSPFRIASTTFSLQLEKQANGDTLSLNTLPEGIADPPGVDPSDTISGAEIIALTPDVTTTVSDTIGNGPHGNEDVDLVTVTLGVGQPLLIDVDTPSSNLDSYIRIFDDSGTQVASNDNDDEGYGDAQLQFQAPSAGNFHIGISDSSNYNYNPTVGASGSGYSYTTGSYDMHLTMGQQGSPDVPGDSLAGAQPIVLTADVASVFNEFVGDGYFGDKDVDFYRVALEAGQTLTVDIDTPTSSLDSYLRLLDRNGDEIANQNNEAFNNNDPLLERIIIESGEYYIAVSGYANVDFDPEVMGSGTIASTGDYTINITATTAAVADPPGDTTATAQQVELVDNGTITLNESIGNGWFGDLDVDIHAVTLALGQTLDVELDSSGSTLDGYIRLYNVDGNEVASSGNTGAGGNNAALQYTVENTIGWSNVAYFFVGISALGNKYYNRSVGGSGVVAQTGDYALNLTTTAAPTADVPGDILDEATAVALTSAITSTYSETIGNGLYMGRDVDMYQVSLGHAQGLTVDIDTPGGSDLDSYVRIFDESGSQVASHDNEDDGYGTGSTDSFISFHAPRTGNYTIAVSGSGNWNYESERAGTGTNGSLGDYDLKLTSGAVEAPGDAISGAMLLSPAPTTAYAGTIGDHAFTRKDVDFFAVDLVAGDTLEVDAQTPTGSLDSYLRLFNASGEELVETDDGGTGTDAMFEFQAASTGTYYIGVSSRYNSNYNPLLAGTSSWGTTSGDYTLAVSRSTTSDTVGDTMASATPVSLSSSLTWFLETEIGDGQTGATDIDMFSVSLVSGQSLVLDVDTPDSSLDSYMRLFDPAGNELVTNDDNQNDPDARLSFTATQSGTHFFGVSAKGNQAYDPATAAMANPGLGVGSYRVRASVFDANQPATRTWISDTDGDWDDPSNWSGGIVPVAGDHVVIDRGTAEPVVTIPAGLQVDVASLDSTEQVVVTDQAEDDGYGGGAPSASVLRLGQVSAISRLVLAGGEVHVDSELDISGAFTWNSGTLTGPGETRVTGTAQIEQSSPGWSDSFLDLDGGVLSLAGTTTWTSGTLGALNGSVLNNLGTFNIVGTGNISPWTDPYDYGYPEPTDTLFANFGTLAHSGSNYFTISTRVENYGTVQVDPNKNLELGDSTPVVQHGGLIDIDGGTISVNNDEYYGYEGSVGLLQILDGAVTATGALNASIELHGDLQLGTSPGILEVGGDLKVAADGVVNLSVAGLAAGTQHDQIQVYGQIAIAGELIVNRAYESVLGDKMVLLTNANSGSDPNGGYYSVLDAVDGAFSGKEEWEPWSIDNHLFRLTYQGVNGADTGYRGPLGNDVVLHHAGAGFILDDFNHPEGHDNQVVFQIPVRLDAPSAFQTTVDYATAPGLAEAGVHYQHVTGTLTFAPGETEKFVSVPVFGDREADPTADFYVHLSSPVGGQLISGNAQVNILNDDYSGLPDNLGTEFWFAVPENLNSNSYLTQKWEENFGYDPGFTGPIPENPQGFFLKITSPEGATGVVSAPGIDFSLPFTVAAGETIQLRIPDELEPFGFSSAYFPSEKEGQTDIIYPHGIQVTSDNEIAAYGMALQQYTTDGFLILPTDVIGDHYLLSSQESFFPNRGTSGYGPYGHSQGSQFQVIGTVDNTVVEITSTAGFYRYYDYENGDIYDETPQIEPGDTYEVVLNRGDVYSLRATQANSDFTGTEIISSAPVSVLTGSTCTNIPVGYAACDILVEQVPPVNTWGTEFVVNPLDVRNVDRVRIVASEDSTEVTIDGSVYALDKGEYEEIDLREPTVILSNSPVQVSQFSTGQDYRGEGGNLAKTPGDPAMVLIPPSEQFLTEYTVTTNIDRDNDNFISLVVPDVITADVTINGIPIDPSEFTDVDGSDYSVATLSVDDGSYTLEAPLPFGVTSYGFSNYESYAYLGGQSFVPLDVSATLDLTPETAQRMLGQQQIFTANVTDQDGQPLVGVRVDFSIEGPNAGFDSARTDVDGNATIEIDGVNAGLDTVTATAIGSTDVSTVDWIGGTPTIEIVSPDFGYETEAGRTVLVSGVVASGSPDARVVSVYVDGAYINGVPVQGQTIESVDAVGNFFTSLELPWGVSSYSFTVVNSFGHSATTTLDLTGINEQPGGPVLDSLIDLSSIVETYARTSFDDRTDTLYADVTIHNSGNYPVGKPVYVGIANLSDPTVIPLGIAGHWADGTPYYDLTDLVSGDQLDAGESTEMTTLAFEVPSRSPFTYDLVLLGSENREPAFTSVPVITARGGVGNTYNAPVTAADPDGDIVSYDILSGPSGLQLSTGSDGSTLLVWADPPASPANYPVSLEADDGRGGLAEQSFVISVADGTLNRPPVFTSTPQLDAFVGADYQYNADARDADGDTLVYSLSVIRTGDVSQTELAGTLVTIDSASGLIQWQPTAGDIGDYNVTVTASDQFGVAINPPDGNPGLAHQSYTMTVGPRVGNFPPVYTSTPTTQVNAGIVYEYQATAVDPDDDALTFSLDSASTAGATITTDGLLTFNVPSSATANYPFTIIVDDGNGNRVSQPFTLNATDTTPASLAGRVYEDGDDSGDYGVSTDTAMSGWTVYLDTNSNFRFDTGETNVATGADGSYTIDSIAGANYRVGIVRDAEFVTVTPAGKYHTGSASAGQTVGGLDFVVAARPPINSAPTIISNPPATAALLQPFVYDVDAIDPDGDTLNYQLLSDIPGMTIDPASGVIRWLPLVGEQDLVKDIVVRVSDGRGGTDRQLFWPEFVFDNSAPTITSTPPVPAAVSVAYSYQVTATDPDGDILAYSLDPASEARGAAIDIDTGLLTWPQPVAGQFDFEVTAADSRGAHAVQSFTLPVLLDAYPVFDMPARVSTPLGTPIQIHAKATDPLGDVVTVLLDPQAIQMGASLQSIDVTGDTIPEPTLVFDPPTAREFPITLLAHDPAGHSVTWTVIVDAYEPSATNRPPTITDVPAPVLRRDLEAAFVATATDPDRDDITFALPSGPAGMSINANSGEITWQPVAAGNFDFTVTASDGNGGVDQRTVTITVLDNAPPRFTSTPTRNATVGSAYTYDADGAAEAIDPNAGETALLRFRALVSPTFTSFGNDPSQWPEVDVTIDPVSGALDWTPSQAGDYFVTLVVTDPAGEIATQSYFVSATSAGANNAPDILPTPAPRGVISSDVRLDYQATAVDIDNDPLSFLLVSGPAGMTVTPEGRVQYTPSSSELGTSGTYTLSVSDGRGGTDSQEFSYTVSLDALSDNGPPQFTSVPRFFAQAGSPYVYNADAIDPDADRITYSLTQGPAGMSVDPATGLTQWNPTVQALGEHFVVITATDIAGAATPHPYTLRVVRGDAAPQITSSPVVESRAGDFYRYGVNATDADGDAIEFYLGVGTSSNFPLQLDPSTGVLSGTTDVETTYDVEIIAIDPTDRFDTQTFTLTVKPDPTVDPGGGGGGTFPLPDNVPPTITTQPGLTASALDPYVYQFDAIDPDLIRGDTLAWSLPISITPTPTNDFVIDEVNQTLTWTPTVAEIDEEFNLRLQVTDGSGAYSYQDWPLTVTPQNQAPTLAPVANQTVAAGATLAVDAVGDDPDDDPLTYTLDQASLDRGITIDNLGRLRWQTTTDDLPDSPVSVTVNLSDGKLSATPPRTFVVSLTPDQTAPTVGLTSSRVAVEAGEFFDLSVSASDNVGIEGRTLQLVSITDFQNNTTTLDQSLTLTDAGLARFTAGESQLGLLRFVATATDTSGLTATSSIVEVLVLDPNDTTRPQVQIISPLTGDDSVGPADIIGSVNDDGAGVSWKLEISSVDGSGVSRTLADGIGTFTADVIGLFDPTMLAEGSYALTLSAIDAGSNTDSDTVVLDVGRDFKLGNFSLSFTDLQIPVAGIPITIIRNYDTLDAEVSGDFGYGWDLEIVQPELRVVQGSTGAPGLGSRYPTFVNGTRVKVTTPEGTEEGFTVKWVPSQTGSFLSFTPYYRPSFVPDPGNKYSLTPPGADMAFSRLTENGSYTLAGDTREYSASDPSFGNAYLLTESGPSTKGLTYTINATTGTGSRVADKYGNELEYREDGIFSNRGRNVTFTRDWRGRITSITDPAGGVLAYEYDVQGRLVSFYDRLATERLTDGIPGNEFSPTRFEYDPDFSDSSGTPIEGLDNYLTKIIDPIGTTALETEYDPETGRLIALLDAEGNASTLDYNIAAEESTVTSQSTGNPSSSSFDGHGRLIRETNQSGQTSVFTYAGDARYPYQTIQVVGDSDGAAAWADRSGDDRVTTRQYHPEFDGAVTEEVDADGNRTVTAYNTWGYDRGTPDAVYGPDGSVTNYHWFDLTGDGGLNLVSTTDQDGNATSYSYDTRGNITSVTQSNANVGLLGAASSFVYDDFGDLVEVVDADGNIRQISYDENGRQTGTRFAHYPGDERPATQSEYQDPGYSGPALPPLTRTLIETSNTIDSAGNVLSSQTLVSYQEWDDSLDGQNNPLFEPWQEDGYVTLTQETRNASGTTEYDALGRAFRTTDENGRVSETLFDSRGLAVQTRTESPDEVGNGVWLVSNTVYDADGRAVYSTGSFPEGTPDADITGTHTIYDSATGRVDQSQQLLGVNIDVTASANPAVYTAALVAAGTVLSFSSSVYDDQDRVVETSNDHGLRSQTLYDENGRVIESRSEVVDTSGPTPVKNWMVSRTLYDTDGKVLASTDRFFVPEGTPLGNDPVGGPVTTRITKTIYDDRDRTIATERYTGGSVSLTGTFDPAGTSYHPGFTLSDGTLASVSETLYDAAGRVWRTISGRVPESTLSPTALAQSQALAGFPTHGDGADPYAGQGLSSGILSDPMFDTRGRQFGSLGHPLPAAGVGLSGGDYDGNLVRPRTETLYSDYGQSKVQRSGLAHIISPADVFVSVQDNQSVDIVSHFDAFGNVVRTDHVTGGTLSSNSARNTSHVRTGGIVDSFMMTHFDIENRPIAEMQSLPGFVTASYDPAQRTFAIDSVSTNNTPYTQSHTVGEHVPTKLYNYDADDRLESVELPAVPDPDNSVTPTRPKYEYAYDEQGNQTLIVDPLGRETRFSFTDRGQQATRTLPLGFGDDGVQGTADDASASSFSESFTYDDRGRQVTHTSFEGIISETVYDGFGRMWAMNYFASATDHAAGLISQRDEYSFDDHGRRDSFTRYTTISGIGFQPVIQNNSIAGDTNFTESRTEVTVYDSRGRIEAEESAEGVLRYSYDEQGRMTSTAVADSLIAPASRVTSYGYDLLGRLVDVTEDATPADSNDDPQVDTDYAFDLQGRARTTLTGTLVTLPSLMTVYQYDSLGRLDVLTEGKLTASSYELTASYDYDVRADGKRTAVDETFWIDADDDGVQDSGELETTTTTWSYDPMGRLTDEVIDHWDDAFDQTESYAYDLTGNRIALDRDLGNNSTIDESIDYRYDANDRLFAELSDSTDDTTTIYGYDHTQQTAKTVYTTLLSEAIIDALAGGGDDSAQQRVSAQSFTYNLQGRMNQAVVDAYDASGNLQTRTRSTYEYDLRSFRVGQYLENWNASTSQFELESDTEFLVSHRNHTGYAQTLRETITNADGSTKTTDYTFGNDEIAQRVVERDDQAVITSDTTQVFGHDGHGSVRVLYDLGATGENLIQQIATYTAYGVMLAVHNGVGTALASNAWASTLSYSGEAWDSTLNRGYNRARWYDASSAQWNRLDPFSGNMQDPQSLHKYAYVHGDPINGTDPTGMWSIGSVLGSFSLGAAINGLVVGSITGAAGGAVDSYLGGDDVVEGALWGAGIGGALGFVTGGFSVGLTAYVQGLSISQKLLAMRTMYFLSAAAAGWGMATAKNGWQAAYRGSIGLLGVVANATAIRGTLKNLWVQNTSRSAAQSTTRRMAEAFEALGMRADEALGTALAFMRPKIRPDGRHLTGEADILKFFGRKPGSAKAPEALLESIDGYRGVEVKNQIHPDAGHAMQKFESIKQLLDEKGLATDGFDLVIDKTKFNGFRDPNYSVGPNSELLYMGAAVEVDGLAVAVIEATL